MKKVIVFAFFVSMFGVSTAQNNQLIEKTYEFGKILKNDQAEINAQFVTIKNDSVEYYEAESSVRRSIELSKVNEIQTLNGNYSGTGGLIGGLLGVGVGVLISLANTEESTSNSGNLQITETKVQTWPIYAFGALGYLLGAAVGASSEDWETVYSKSSALLKNINLQVNNNLGGYSINYRLHF